MNIKTLGLVSTALFLSSGCATALTPEAGQIRIVESKSEHDCTFVTTLSASDVGGFGPEQQSDNALNKLRNKAAEAELNGVRIIALNAASGQGATVSAEGLRCNFDD